MNRLHVHLHVRDVAESAKFYSRLFGAAPTKQEPDYAKWMLENPRVNFAISSRGGEIGLSHLGIQVETEVELVEASARAKSAVGEILIEKGAHCCYAVGIKPGQKTPKVCAGETFLTTGDLTTYGMGADKVRRERADAQSCCSPGDISASGKTSPGCCPG